MYFTHTLWLSCGVIFNDQFIHRSRGKKINQASWIYVHCARNTWNKIVICQHENLINSNLIGQHKIRMKPYWETEVLVDRTFFFYLFSICLFLPSCWTLRSDVTSAHDPHGHHRALFLHEHLLILFFFKCHGVVVNLHNRCLCSFIVWNVWKHKWKGQNFLKTSDYCWQLQPYCSISSIICGNKWQTK